jgi:hypothetical protein
LVDGNDDDDDDGSGDESDDTGKFRKHEKAVTNAKTPEEKEKALKGFLNAKAGKIAVTVQLGPDEENLVVGKARWPHLCEGLSERYWFQYSIERGWRKDAKGKVFIDPDTKKPIQDGNIHAQMCLIAKSKNDRMRNGDIQKRISKAAGTVLKCHIETQKTRKNVFSWDYCGMLNYPPATDPFYKRNKHKKEVIVNKNVIFYSFNIVFFNF